MLYLNLVPLKALYARKEPEMEIGAFHAFGGRFYAEHSEISKLIATPRGLPWDLALSDGWIDPNYCKARLKVTNFRKARPTKEQPKRTLVIEGVVTFSDGKEMPFDGYSNDSP